ncbi:PAS domain S-box protein [Mucilaginibacter robiniae]|uniref:histidine kinase n=1 Tax=Mucilaginibacter robiniae TaxID=2728022 RepID=A0A7L5E1G4_9SPHI|nr:ATP-binding protein [Mucilaginibacter robiniae]QJD97230.1 PAS domain S-box protein [Mucilaginibacter robiniae]
MENTFGMDIIPDNDQERLAALQRYRILDTPTERAFDKVVELAAELFQVPVALISLVDAEQVFYKATVGMGDVRCGSRGHCVCALAIVNSECTIIENALQDPLFDHNPLVHGSFGLRFYAGAPLITHDGYFIGTICVIDTQPRLFNPQEEKVLKRMAAVVMEQIELRLTNLREAEKQARANNELAESYKKLAASEQRFQNILDTMAEGVGIIDLDGCLTYSNAMAQRILGLSQSEINKRTYYDAKWQNVRLDGTPLPKEDHPMSIMLNTGMAVYDYEIGVKPQEGEVFYLSINAAPIIDQNTGKITGGIATFMDVTNRRRVMQQKDEFISVASHELKTPVTSLTASMQLMERMIDNPKPAVISKLINQANKSLKKLNSLIKDLLNSTRISEGQLHLRKVEFTIADMITDCCHHIRTAGKHEIVLQGDLNLKIYADEQQIDQVVVNLVNNAVKYAPDSKEICITVGREKNRVKVSVADKGPGIDPDTIPHLFDRYYRADYSGIQFSGLGLGLYICAEIIRKHGGEIGVDSQLSEGSTFWFTLPLS